MSGRTLVETFDARGFDTPYVLNAGDIFQGNKPNSRSSSDYIGVSVQEGQSYVVTVTPSVSWRQNNLRLLEEERGFLSWGAATGNSGTATLKFVADKTGIFHIAVDFSGSGIGDYEVTFDEDPDFAPWPLDDIADYLTDGYWLDTDEPVAKWDFSDQNGAKVLTYDATALGDTGEEAAKQAFRAWTDVSGIEFVATTNAPDIVFTQGGNSAYATHDLVGNVLIGAQINMYETGFEDYGDFVVDEHEVLVHEIGHALGLGHAGPYNFTGIYEVDALHAADTVRTSVMSYFDAGEEAFVDMYDFDVLTPMAADIIAIQNLYGAVAMNTDDTIYGQNSDISDLSQLPDGVLGSYSASYQDLLGEGAASLQRYIYTIRDDGGTDTIDYARHWTNVEIDLTIAGPDTVTIAERNIVLAPGTIIENAIAGRFDDSVIGNAVANNLSGNAGDDTIKGHSGDDHLDGGADHDLLLGGAGGDTLNGGTGDDTLFGEDHSRIVHSHEYQQIHRLYQTIFGRAPDEEGHEYWTDQLLDGARSHHSIAQFFSRSIEFTKVYGLDLPKDDFVKLLYRNVLDRAPNDAELEGWTSRINELGSRTNVIVGFAESAEFIRNSGAQTSLLVESKFAQFWTDDVYRLYQATLGRDPDLAGLQGWSDVLAGGTALLDVIAGFTNSAEFNAVYGDLANSAFIDLLYENVLDRTAALAETDAWLARIDDGQSRDEVVFDFAQSVEFRQATATPTVDWVRSHGLDDDLDGGSGDNTLVGGDMADRFVFRTPPMDDPDTDTDLTTQYTVFDLEFWDLLDFTDFGYAHKRDVIEQMSQVLNDVIFEDDGVKVTLKDTDIAEISADMISIAPDDPFFVV